ncbi:MAG: T9SS type A sorting domain-containing protein [Flavobacteriales bacterium]
MKHLTLLAAMALTTGAFAQRTAITAEHPLNVNIFNADRTPTDTLIPTSFADPNGSPTIYSLTGLPGEYVVGTNHYDQGMAQNFTSTGSVNVEQLLYLFAIKNDAGQPASVIHARVYALDGAGTNEANTAVTNAPGSVLGDVSLPMSAIDTATDALMITVANFTPAIQVTGNFAGGFDFAGLPTGSELSLWSTTDGDNTTPDQNWENAIDGTWIAMGNTQLGWGLHLDFGILAVLGDGIAGINDIATVNNMRMSFIGSNPADKKITVAYEMLKAADARLLVLDGKGAQVVDQQLGRTATGLHQSDLNVSDWSNGTYYVSVIANGNPITKKLVVQH